MSNPSAFPLSAIDDDNNRQDNEDTSSSVIPPDVHIPLSTVPSLNDSKASNDASNKSRKRKSIRFGNDEEDNKKARGDGDGMDESTMNPRPPHPHRQTAVSPIEISSELFTPKPNGDSNQSSDRHSISQNNSSLGSATGNSNMSSIGGSIACAAPPSANGSANTKSSHSLSSNQTLITHHLTNNSNHKASEKPVPVATPTKSNVNKTPRKKNTQKKMNPLTNSLSKRKSSIPIRRSSPSIIEGCAATSKGDEKPPPITVITPNVTDYSPTPNDEDKTDNTTTSTLITDQQNKILQSKVQDMPSTPTKGKSDNITMTTPPVVSIPQDPSFRGSFNLPPSQRPTSTTKSNGSKRSASSTTVPKKNSDITSFFVGVQKGTNQKLSSRNIFAPKGKKDMKSNDQGNKSNTQESLEKEIITIKEQVQSLIQSNKDKDEQLKAVSNTKTIIHTSLKAKVEEQEKKITCLEQDIKKKDARARHIIETLVRKESNKENFELRQKLATDGARLGRWVQNGHYSRLGMHAVQPVWEDGSAIREFKKRKDNLKKKRLSLEEARSKGLEQWKKENNDEYSNHVDGTSDPFESEEFDQSMWMHMTELKREETELLKDEEALNMEKVKHKRALKRVSSEDSSRFKSRPKMNDRYVLLYLLGKGGFSEVWRAYDLKAFREVAVKIHQLDPRWSEAKIENYTKHVAREYEIHRDVRHPRIVSLHDVFEIDSDSFATVLECCDGTDLDTLLQERKRLTEQHARAILLQVLSGMKYLSTPSANKIRQGIIHYDLKPGNILFDESGNAKITDFGLSKILDSSDPTNSMELTSQGAGTYWYLPPECFVTTSNVRITNKVDVWSIGVIFYQMLYGKRPFGHGQSQENVLNNHIMLNAREVVFPSNPLVSEECKDFIRQCLAYEQSLRPSIAQLCESPYVKKKIPCELNDISVESREMP